MSIFQPFAFMAGQSTTPAGFDPTLGGTVNPEYWWDLQNSDYLTLSSGNITAAINRGSEGAAGDLTTSHGTLGFTTDSLGKLQATFTGTQRLGKTTTLIPYFTNCTTFIAYNPKNLGGSSQQVFAHEGWTFGSAFPEIERSSINKGTSSTIVFDFNGTVYPYGTAYTTTPASTDIGSRPVLQNSTDRFWLRQGYDNYSSTMFDNANVAISTRSWSGSNTCTVSAAINSSTTTSTLSTSWLNSTSPDEGTAIGNAGRNSIRDPYYGGVYTAIIYLQKLTDPQIAALYNSWVDNF